jgi:hypothetical protein
VDVIMTECIISESSSTMEAKALKSQFRIALRQISNRRGASATRASCSGLVGARECPSVDPVFLWDALTMATQSTSFQ